MQDKISAHPSLRYASEIAEICKPLQKLNITYFSHVRISRENKLAALGAHPTFSEHYLKNQFFLLDIHMLDEQKVGEFFVWDNIIFNGQSERLCLTASEFGIHNPFTIIHKGKYGIDYYHFANNTMQKQINQIYLANLDLLQRFIAHFKDNIQQAKNLQRAYQSPFEIVLPNIKPSLNFENETTQCNRHDFLASMTASTFPRLEIDNIRLSKRQTEILRYMVLGKTLKEISQQLNLSPRTVGHYWETIKNKLTIASRAELIAKAIEHQSLPLFKGLEYKNQ